MNVGQECLLKDSVSRLMQLKSVSKRDGLLKDSYCQGLWNFCKWELFSILQRDHSIYSRDLNVVKATHT